jgi:dolichol-phosphate mannosyltransferase
MTVALQQRPLVSVVIPVYNEEAGMEQLHRRLAKLKALWQERVAVELVFVNDGSSDNTQRRLETVFGDAAGCRIVAHERNRGIGAAFRTGFRHCHGTVVCTIDADCSYGPENLLRLLSALDDQNADIAIASPYHPQGTVEGVAQWRLLLSRSCSAFYRAIAPVKLHTYTSVFRAYRRDVVENVQFLEDGFESATEILIRAAEQGYHIAEVPMTLHARQIGQTKMKIVRTIRGHLRLLTSTAQRQGRIDGADKRPRRARLQESKPEPSLDLHR